MKKIKEKWSPKEWQTNPENIKTEKVQYWNDCCMLTAQMLKSEAQELVKIGKAFIITEQAIGVLK